MIRLTVTLLSLFISIPLQAFNNQIICDGSAEKPCIIQDTLPNSVSLACMRDLTQIIPSPITENDSSLWVSASANPNEDGWHQLAEYIHHKTNNRVKHLYALDLRQETHAYLNGSSITLSDTYNWINVGKSTEQAEKAEQDWIHAISAEREIYGVLTPEQFFEKNFNAGQTVNIDSLVNEKQLITNEEFTYVRMAVTDHRAPLDPVVDTFVSFVQQVPKKSWLHIHCRGGKGRSTTFMVMYDMLKNADKNSFEEIIARHAAVPPYYDLANITRANSELSFYFKERYEFIQNFYRYAQQLSAGYNGSWSQWKQANSGGYRNA